MVSKGCEEKVTFLIKMNQPTVYRNASQNVYNTYKPLCSRIWTLVFVKQIPFNDC